MDKSNSYLFVHLFNNYSGSPKVLSDVIDVMKDNGVSYKLITSSTDGFLNKHVTSSFVYTWSERKLLTLIFFIFAQIQIAIYMIVNRKSFDVVYVNTILPFAAAAVGKLLGKKVIYHIHETSISPKFLDLFLKKFIKLFSDQAIFVSDFLRQEYEGVISCKSEVLYNCSTYHSSSRCLDKAVIKDKKRVTFVTSFKEYKGIFVFSSLVQCLKNNDNYLFDFVCNDLSDDDLNSLNLPKDMVNVVTGLSNLTSLYEESNLILNLSLPEQCIETFGLTVAEAMCFGVPAIVPPVGGPSEIVINGYNGHHCNPHDLPKLVQLIEDILDEKNYQNFSSNAFNQSQLFSRLAYEENLLNILGKE
ncbi:glycosyltransferase family 4 protein [Photobacterium ganghwense]|uniref:glycosyltransferase family 4 protein n=1 Tax=Photobacterium ganghwense TaxID=320778 RepID=UPI0040559F02